MKATGFGLSAGVGDAALALEQCAEENGGSTAIMLIDEVAKISKVFRPKKARSLGRRSTLSWLWRQAAYEIQMRPRSCGQRL
jgi:hypothetical protein